jgi:hypothetical protein
MRINRGVRAFCICLVVPHTAMQVAVRRPIKGTLMTLWLHEYFAVFGNNKRSRPRGLRELDFYQAIEFSTGRDMPAECRLGLSDKELAQIWVKGLYFAPASRIRKARRDLPKDRYIFQKDTALDWEPAIQYKAEMGNCPELVLVTNCTMWHPMSDVLHMLPRVVHPVDVQTHRVYVNGRDGHFVCGVMATELSTLADSKRSGSASHTGTCGFALAMLDRKQHCMYPEERLGTVINSHSSQWDNIDELFQHIRNVMTVGTGSVSGSFSMQWTNACQRFWEVRLSFCSTVILNVFLM